MEPQRSTNFIWWLHNVSTGEWIGLKIKHLLVNTAWLRNANVPAHLAQNVLMKMPEQPFDDHECFVSNRGCNCARVVASMKQDLGGREDIWIENVSSISPSFNVFRGARESNYDLIDLFLQSLYDPLRVLEGAKQMQSLRHGNGLEPQCIIGNTGRPKDLPHEFHKLRIWHVGQVLHRFLL